MKEKTPIHGDEDCREHHHQKLKSPSRWHISAFGHRLNPPQRDSAEDLVADDQTEQTDDHASVVGRENRGEFGEICDSAYRARPAIQSKQSERDHERVENVQSLRSRTENQSEDQNV